MYILAEPTPDPQRPQSPEISTPLCCDDDLTLANETEDSPEFREEEFWTDDLMDYFRNEDTAGEEAADFFIAEAEHEEQLRQRAEGNAAASKTSKKKTKKPALVRCNVCNKPFNSVDGYLKHRKRHAMQG